MASLDWWILGVATITSLATALAAIGAKPGAGDSKPTKTVAEPAPQNADLTGWKILVRRLEEVASRIERFDPHQAARVEMTLLDNLISFRNTFQRWKDSVQRTKVNRNVYEKSLRDSSDAIETRISEIQSRGLPSDAGSEKRDWDRMHDIVKRGVQLLDRDLDRSRQNRELQSTIEELASKAKLELYEPKRGESVRSQKGEFRKVDKVRVRGLRTREGKTFLEPEIEEQR